MKNHEMVTLQRDDQRLSELEKVIARGKKTFVEVGLALAEIRDQRLYRREYSGFEEYCRKKWGWTKQHAYRLIEAAPIAESNTRVTSLNQARELAKVEPAQRAGVVQAIVDSGKPVTAKEIKRHLPPPPMPKSNLQVTPPPIEANSKKSNLQVTLSNSATDGHLPPPPSQVLDATGWPIPTQLIPLWQRANEVQELLTILSRVKGTLRAAQENRDKLFAEVNFSSALSQLDQAWTDIKTAKPFAVCPACQGQVPEHCTLCCGRGLISEFRWNTCVPREDKEFRQRAQQKSAKGKERP
jgi:hypothetical protein